ncbi:MAG: DUF6175 family protein [Tannerellaceae bacterium]|jgi:hypothetical protein|nr:DUF6175 family protein [Tannerellaceae bacterium]
MRKYMLLLCVIGACLSAFGQARKPTLMVVPGQGWCYKNNYKTTYDNQGVEASIPDYQRALLEDKDLRNVITQIGILMTDRGFPLQSLEATLNSLATEAAENELTRSASGEGLAESPLDALNRRAKADIRLEIEWSVEVSGFNQIVTYNLVGMDAYTNVQIAAALGVSAPSSSTPLPVLLKEAVNANMDNFNSQLQAHFDNMFANGREVIIDIRLFNGADFDLETEYDGYALSEIIEEWIDQNTVERRFSKVGGSENYLKFNQVRIPLFNASGRAIDAEGFVRELRRFLGRDPYNLPGKVQPKGLGQCVLILGDK